MGQRTVTETVWECDACKNQATAPENSGPWTPPGWLHLQGAGSAADWFCSWICLSDYAEVMADGERKRAALGGDAG